jgi:tetratricopeptide (TPR) repeat protein
MTFRPWFNRLVFLSTAGVLWLTCSGQTAPAEKARQEKAREYLKLAQDNFAKSNDDMLVDMGRGNICRVQANLGELSAAKKTADSINFLKGQAQVAVARIEARTDKQGAIQYLHTLGAISDPDDLATIGEAQADMGDIDGARQRVSALKPSWQQAKVLVAVGRAQAKAGDLPAATQSFTSAKTALKANTDPFPWLRPVDIACAQMETGDGAAARQTANEITDPNERAAAIAALSHLADPKPDKTVARERLELARKTLADNKNPSHDALIGLALAYSAAGDKDTAQALLAQARTVADAIDPQREMRPEALADVALAQRAVGDATSAADTLKAAKAALDKMTNAANRTHALWVIAGSQAASGDTAGAGQTLALALKGQMDSAETAMQAAGIAGALARAAGATAEFSWITQLRTPEGKGLAYAAAAAGMFNINEAK